MVASGQFMGGAQGPNADGTGMFSGLSNFLAMGGSLDEYLVRAFPKTAGKEFANMKGILSGNFEKIPQGIGKTTIRRGATKVAGMGGRRFPLLAGGLQFLGGDPVGGVGRAAGGFAGASILGKLGMATGNPLIAGGLALAGGIFGGDIGQGITRSATGIDISDPLSGPNFSIPIPGGGIENDIPLTPYAKTLKSRERSRKERIKDMESMKPYLEQEFQRRMLMQQQAITGNIIQSVIGATGRK